MRAVEADAARERGLIEQTLGNWVKAASTGAFTGPKQGTIAVEQRAISRLKAELMRTQRALERLKKAAASCANDALCRMPGLKRMRDSTGWVNGAAPGP